MSNITLSTLPVPEIDLGALKMREWKMREQIAEVENTGVDKVWKTVRIKYGINELRRRIGLAYCKCKAASGSTLLV